MFLLCFVGLFLCLLLFERLFVCRFALMFTCLSVPCVCVFVFMFLYLLFLFLFASFGCLLASLLMLKLLF